MYSLLVPQLIFISDSPKLQTLQSKLTFTHTHTHALTWRGRNKHIYHTTQFHSCRKWQAHGGWTSRGVIEQIIYFLPNLLSFTLSLFLLSPFIGGCLSLGKSLLCLQQPDISNRKERKVFSLSERVRERGNVVRGLKMNPYVCEHGCKFHPHSRQSCINGELLRVQPSMICWTSHHSCSRTQKLQKKWIIFMSRPITLTVNSFVNLPCLPFHSSALVVSQGKEKVSRLG